ncbi:MAG TPA: SemiSWEET family transporter [Alphaproteobacteria bacterium]|nr:SemiSWEET family transporter [Alphaproteobacteria bacterium]
MLIDILASVTGILMSLAYYPEALEIIKNKSSKNVSRLSYGLFALGTTTWLVYGIIIKSLPVILGFALGVVGSWLVLILTFVYGKKK